MTAGSPTAPNIGPREGRRRFTLGVVALLLSLPLGVLLARAPLALRGLLFVPLLFAALGILQAREKT